MVKIIPSGLGSGRVTFPAAGFECTFAHEVVRRRVPVGRAIDICIYGLPPEDSLTIVAEPLWFASFGGWSAQCQPADQPTCRLVGITSPVNEVHVRFDLTGTPPLTAVSGNDQYGTPGNALALPVVVQLRDSLDNPVINEALEFETDEPDGLFVPATGTTDANGQFATTWILGSRFADQTGRVSATSESMWYATLELRATVVN